MEHLLIRSKEFALVVSPGLKQSTRKTKTVAFVPKVVVSFFLFKLQPVDGSNDARTRYGGFTVV